MIDEEQKTLNSLCLTCKNRPCGTLIEMRKEEPNPFVTKCSAYNVTMD